MMRYLAILLMLTGCAGLPAYEPLQFAKSLPIGFKPWGHQQLENGTHRFEVRPGDCSRAKSLVGWDDCRNDRERHELKQIGKLQFDGDCYRYRWRIRVGREWKTTWPTKVHLGQFHQEGGRPVFMFTEYPDGLNIVNHLDGSRRLLVPSPAMKEWNRLNVSACWGMSALGSFSVKVNGQKKYGYRGPTLTAKAVYFKFGIYRAFISRNPLSRSVVLVAFFTTPERRAFQIDAGRRSF